MFKRVTLTKAIPWILIISGFIGLACAGIITYDKMKLLENPAFQPNCDLNPVISCGSVMSSPQSHIFGFSNSFIGLAGFPILITMGMGIFAGAKYKRWFWIGLQLGTLFGIAFVHWLFFQSVYRINALCPYCMVVWTVTITSFWYTLLYNLQEKHIILRAKLAGVGVFARKHHLDILILWLVLIAAFILKHFWYYYRSKLGF